MENKLQELTRKLYDEGLSQGKLDADKLIAEAQAEAKRIVAEVQAQADAIMADVEKKAAETSKTAMTELSLAGKQAVAALKESIEKMITAKCVAPSVKEANMDVAFVKEMLLAVAGNWQSSQGGKVQLAAMLPAGWQEKFDAEIKGSVEALLKAGIEVGYSDRVKSGFKIGEKDGGYFISFSDADYNALLSTYLKEKIAKILYS
ncbi:MAG: hypothetical protein IKM58_03280 [Tidjanibacter sp.]|nr:hypothetical protein [Tidjanibacter sp.]